MGGLPMMAGLYLAPGGHGRAEAQKTAKSLRLSLALLLSLALHLVIAAPFLLLDPYEAKSAQQDRLLLEVYGMIAERQREERVQGDQPPVAGQPEQQATEAPQQETARMPPEEAVEAQPETAEPTPPVEQVQDSGPVPLLDEPPAQEPPAVQEAPAVQETPVMQETPRTQPVVAADSHPGTEIQQQQQTISHEELEANLLREYLRSLRRTIQGSLVYPAAARRAGVQGTPVISFRITEDGEILSGSLRVTRSSGYPALDESALAAAAASAPFERPRRSMEVSIAVSFSRD